MERHYVMSDPEQLKAAAVLCKDGASKVSNVAKVWSTARRKSAVTPWDGRIGVLFSADGRERKACVYRIGTGGERLTLGALKYNAALQWCQQHLSAGNGDAAK